jgi:hypothetical protein
MVYISTSLGMQWLTIYSANWLKLWCDYALFWRAKFCVDLHKCFDDFFFRKTCTLFLYGIALTLKWKQEVLPNINILFTLFTPHIVT